MSRVWPYIVSAVTVAIAVAGIAALAEVDLWTPMHARVTGVAMIFTAFMHYPDFANSALEEMITR